VCVWRWPCALRIEYNSCNNLCQIFSMFMHIHSFTQSHAYHTVAVSSCGFKLSVSAVMFYVLAAGVVAVCVIVFSLFVCLQVLLMVLRLVSPEVVGC